MNMKYWFFLEPHIYVSFKSDTILLYDTHTGKSLYVDSASCISIVNKIYEDDSLGSIELEGFNLEEIELKEFRKQLY